MTQREKETEKFRIFEDNPVCDILFCIQKPRGFKWEMEWYLAKKKSKLVWKIGEDENKILGKY